jgi:DNA-binding CsgD family transcriptional regulator
MDKVEINVDVITGEITQKVSQFTAQELAYSEQVNAQAETAKAQALAIKESALAKLAALGLTASEVASILGNS